MPSRQLPDDSDSVWRIQTHYCGSGIETVECVSQLESACQTQVMTIKGVGRRCSLFPGCLSRQVDDPAFEIRGRTPLVRCTVGCL